MPRDVSKVLKLVITKLEIGTSAYEAEPGAYTDVGLVEDEQLSIKATPISDRELSGLSVQKAYDCTVETSLMQVKDLATIEAFKNANVWIKVTSADGTVLKVKNIFANVAVELNPHSKGKSNVKVTATKYVSQLSDLYTVN